MGNYGIAVTFGRNIGSEPMGEYRWAEFQRDVDKALHDAVHKFARRGMTVGFEYHQGTGQWDDFPEESARVAVYGLDEVSAGSVLDGVEPTVRALCRKFEQDAIAVGFVHTTLVRGE